MKDLSAIERLLMETMGIDAATAGKGTIARAVAAVMKRTGVQDLQAYTGRLQASADERQSLLEEIVVPETWFFRDAGPFEYLKSYARDIWRPAAAGSPLRILSAACATGEEPYSIVMTLLEAGLAPADFRVDAVDISARALASARQASYSRGSFRSELPEEQRKYFQQNGRGLKLSDPVVQAVNFIQDNLASPRHLTAGNPYHAIFCRNMLIYLHGAARQAVFMHLDRLLHPGGILFSGHTETVFWLQNGYLPVRRSRTFALHKPTAAAPGTIDRKPASETGAVKHKEGLRPSPVRKLEDRDSTRAHTPLNPVKAAVDSSGASLDISASKTRPAPADTLSPEHKPQTAPPSDQRIKEARRLADQGLFDQAALLCSEYLRQATTDTEAHCLLGLIHKASGRDEEAATCFNKALYLDPGHYETLIHLSLLYQQQGDARKTTLYRERAQRSERRSRDVES